MSAVAEKSRPGPAAGEGERPASGAAILRGAHLAVVPLDRAMRDPAYRIADHYVGSDGDEWLTRWSLTLHKDLPYGSLPKVPDDIAADDAELEAGAQNVTTMPPSR